MKTFLISILISVALFGCGNPTNKDANTNVGVPPVVTPVNVAVYYKHNSASCPLNLVGTYQLINGRMNRASTEMLHISTQQNGVLVATQQSRGASAYTSLIIADGVRRLIQDTNMNDYQISYCENQTVVTIGLKRGKEFTEVLYGVRQGVELSYSAQRERPYVLTYRRNRL